MFDKGREWNGIINVKSITAVKICLIKFQVWFSKVTRRHRQCLLSFHYFKIIRFIKAIDRVKNIKFDIISYHLILQV